MPDFLTPDNALGIILWLLAIVFLLIKSYTSVVEHFMKKRYVNNGGNPHVQKCAPLMIDALTRDKDIWKPMLERQFAIMDKQSERLEKISTNHYKASLILKQVESNQESTTKALEEINKVLKRLNGAKEGG